MSLYYQLEQAKSHLRKLPGVAEELDNNIEALEVEAHMLKKILLNVVRGMNDTVNKMADAKNKKELAAFKKAYSENSVAAQAVSIYLANLEWTSHADNLYKKIYREHNLPEQFRSRYQANFGYESREGWNEKSWDEQYEKYEKMLIRMLTAEFENLQDEIKADQESMKESFSG